MKRRKLLDRLIAMTMFCVMLMNSELAIHASEIENDNGQNQLKFETVVLDIYNTAAITSNGDLYCWGDNTKGQIGNNSTEIQEKPIKVLSNVIDVVLNDENCMALTKDGELYSWGYNYYGQVGNGNTKNQVVPFKILDNVKSIYSGYHRNGAITNNGDLYCWGWNVYGQVGNGTTTNQLKPVKIMSNVKTCLLAQYAHSAAITNDGDLYCWGQNGQGQIGNGTTTQQLLPIKVMENVKSTSLGFNNSAAITNNGDLYCWGWNSNGQIGDGSKKNQSKPVKVLEKIRYVSMGYKQSAAITNNGDLYCWGINSEYEVGNGNNEDQYEPVKVLEKVYKIMQGEGHVVALDENGVVFCWGNNEHGQIGNGKNGVVKIPCKVYENVKQIFTYMRASHCAIITDNGKLFVWGYNGYGQVGNGTLVDQSVPYEIRGAEDNDPEVIDNDIIKLVSEYTSDEVCAQYEEIQNSDYSDQIKQQKYYELFATNGFVDVKEGVQYISKTTSKRFAYLNLTTDDHYCASGYQYWLDHTRKGNIARGLLITDGLVFNNEMNDWLNFTTYTDSAYPGVKKYKELLYNFMDETSDKIVVESYIKEVKQICKNVNSGAKLYADSLINKLNECKTADEIEEFMKSMEAKEIFAHITSEHDTDGNPIYSFELDKSSGFGQFAESIKNKKRIVSLVGLYFDSVNDLIKMDAKLAIYAQYERFLKEVVNNTNYIPFQLRWAAQQILDEMDAGYAEILKDVAVELINQSSVNSEVLKMIVGKTGASSISAWLTTINIEAYFINKLADVGGMVKKEAYVEGYAYLANAYKEQLEQAKKVFLQNKSEENAWDFYYSYNMLYQLRYKGEEAYLAFTKIDGWASLLYDFGYTDKKLVVDDTLKMLREECKFVFDKDSVLSQSCQFASKVIVKCPVNVKVYDGSGTQIAYLQDAKPIDFTNDDGRFAVVYNAYTDDYQKILCFNTDTDYAIEIQGIDDGLVTLEMSKEQMKDITYSFRNVKLQKNGMIITSIKQLVEDNNYSVDEDGDGIIEETKPISIIGNQYVSVTGITFDKNDVKLVEGDNVVLKAMVTPNNSTYNNIKWISSNPYVASIKNGKIYAVSKGKATVYGISLENSDVMDSCVVSVVGKENINMQAKEEAHKSDTETQSNSLSKRSEIKIFGVSKKIAAGKKIKLVAKEKTSGNEEVKVRWTSSNERYATVSSTGVVKAKKKGIGKSVVIKAESIDEKSIVATYKIKIVKHVVKKIKLKSVKRKIKGGKKTRIRVDVITTGKTANKKLQWISSNIEYATVNQKGVVTTKKEGAGKKVKIIVRSTDGSGKALIVNLKIK